jgi:hypothetical protein
MTVKTTAGPMQLARPSAGASRACRRWDRPQAMAWNSAAAISDVLQAHSLNTSDLTSQRIYEVWA